MGIRACPMTDQQLIETLEGITQLVREGDSFEGNIEYLVPTRQDVSVLDDTYAMVRGVIRVGNRMGQGGMHMIGEYDETVPDSDSIGQLDARHLREQIGRLGKWILEHRPDGVVEGGAVTAAIHLLEQTLDRPGDKGMSTELVPQPLETINVLRLQTTLPFKYEAQYSVGVSGTRSVPVIGLLQQVCEPDGRLSWAAAVVDTDGSVVAASALPDFVGVYPLNPGY